MFFQFWKNQKTLLDALDNSNISEILLKRMMVYAMSDSGAIRHFLPFCNADAQEYGSIFGICGFMATVFAWHRSGYCQTPEQMAHITVNLLAKPFIRTRKV